jgi:hypothetical protein
MKLVGKLKEKVEKAKSLEEAKEVIKEAGIELSDNELKQIAAGTSIFRPEQSYFEDKLDV